MEPGDLIRPPEAPVFQPTREEFKDPVAYLNKIHPVVVNTGICKIKPPTGWRPPFAVNVDSFQFTPRLQPLNELEAKTRVKLNFLDTLSKFWEMQGMSFKVPNVNRVPLDLHKLYKIVTSYGGFHEICYTRKWVFVARKMNYDNLSVSGSLRVNYEKYLFPFEIFQVKIGVLTLPVTSSSKHHYNQSSCGDSPDKTEMMDEQLLHVDYEPKFIQSDVEERTPVSKRNNPRRSKRKRLEDPDYIFQLTEEHPEFKKLAFVAPGPKNDFCLMNNKKDTPPPTKSYKGIQTYGSVSSGHTDTDGSATVDRHGVVPTGDECCIECGDGCSYGNYLSCSSCNSCYHTFCLITELPMMPVSNWYCYQCIAKECCDPPEAFGFEQAKRVHSLQTFGQMANQFKADFFNQTPTEVPYSIVEKEFWRLVTSIDDEITVEYGADLHSSKHGSGFPMRDTHTGDVNISGADEYADCGWNLNNLPVLKGSVLRYIDADISGMKVPWLYVGMCFSCFCWHTEDHWSYSINYLHWGEPKTWYGVPSAYADALEATMKEQAPELFENQPDLMHHLATTLNPSLLMKNGIPVVRTDQCAGEFVVTFPRAYHAGFNQGFNFAEAVNFSLADWLPMGRKSIEHYRITQKTPVFSHDELVCKMIAQPEDLELTVLVMAAKDASNMYSMEEQLRHGVINDGVSRTAMEVFELLPDDERQCAVCQTTCFLSAVRCPCIPNKLTCLHHYKQLCPCPVTDKTLRFRYNLHELKDLILSSQERASLYCEWASRVDQLLDGYNLPKQDITLMKQLLADGDTKRFHNCDQYRDLMSSFKDASLILTSIEEALRPKNRTKLVTASDLKQIIDNIESLPCLLPESVEFKGYVQHIVSFQKEIASTLTDVHNNSSLNMEVIDVLMDLLRRGECLTVEIPQLDDLRNVIEQLMWAQDTESLLSSGKIVHYDHLKSLFKKGQQLSQSKAVESLLIKLKALLCKIHEWEQKIKSALKDKPSHPISLYEEFLKESSQISVAIPLVEVITTLVTRAKEWNNRAQSLQVNDKHPHYDALKGLLSDARSLSVELEQLPQVESRYSAAKAWVDRASRTFSKKNSIHSLLEILLPRNPSINSFAANSKSNKKRTEDEFFVQTSPLSVAEGDRFKEMDIIHNLEKEEKLYIRKVRKSNFDKQLQDEKSSSSLPVLYCQCRKPESGYMLQCEVCNEWYHASCLHIPKSKLNPDNDNNKDVRFICGSCLRSRRPRLDNIVSLLISLQKVPVAISEGTALHCLAERAIAWQKNARELVASARPIVEEARSQQLRIYDITNKIFKWKQETLLEYKGIHHTELNNQADSVLKHYESQLLKEKSKYAGLTGDMRKNVESTLLDGDLLEVTTDETTQLWQTLQTDSDCLSYFALTEEETLKAPLPKLSSQAKKATLMLEEVEQTSPHNSSPQTKKKKNSDNNSSEAKEKSSDSTAVKRKKTTKSSDNKHSTSTATTTKSIKREPTSDTEDMDESTLNEDAICSSPHCIRPMANQISWVQCDVCQQWFHLLCVGLTTESVEKIDIYNCSICKQKCISERKALINNALSKKNTRVYASIVPTTSTASTSRTESS